MYVCLHVHAYVDVKSAQHNNRDQLRANCPAKQTYQKKSPSAAQMNEWTRKAECKKRVTIIAHITHSEEDLERERLRERERSAIFNQLQLNS